jgi:uncharacterized protein YcbK (DUF882 family)
VRSAAINRKVGGAANSQHVVGCAADFIVTNAKGNRVPARQVYRTFVKFWADPNSGIGGIGAYSQSNGTTHADLRTVPATWDWGLR